MTRKDFQLIAEVLSNRDDEPKDIISRFADRLASTNPNFDRQRFIDVATGERAR